MLYCVAIITRVEQERLQALVRIEFLTENFKRNVPDVVVPDRLNKSLAFLAQFSALPGIRFFHDHVECIVVFK